MARITAAMMPIRRLSKTSRVTAYSSPQLIAAKAANAKRMITKLVEPINEVSPIRKYEIPG